VVIRCTTTSYKDSQQFPAPCKLYSGMAAYTILDLSSTVSVPYGIPAIAVTAPLTRPSAADNSLAKSRDEGARDSGNATPCIPD
jgi:hypothetical protein